MENQVDRPGFTNFTKVNPSPRYRELLEMNKIMHHTGSQETGSEPAKTFTGVSLAPHVDAIAELVREHRTETILDFGSGKGTLYADAPNHAPGSRYKSMAAWGEVVVTCYDPAFQPFSSAPPEDRYGGVICTDVLEHIPEEDIPWVLDDLFVRAVRFVYAVAACYPAKKHLPDGSNAHCTLRPPAWWRDQMDLAGRRHTQVHWMLCTGEKSYLAFDQRTKITKKGIRRRIFRGEALSN